MFRFLQMYVVTSPFKYSLITFQTVVDLPFFFDAQRSQNEYIKQSLQNLSENISSQLLQIYKKCLPLQPQSREITINNEILVR